MKSKAARVKSIADSIWEQISNAYHWGDGHQSACERLYKELLKLIEEADDA